MAREAVQEALQSVGFEPTPASVRTRITSEIGLDHSVGGSVALLDFPTVNHVCRLFEGFPIGDPFVGISDLGTLIGAMVFYDRLLVLPVNPVVDRAESILHHGGVLRAVHLDTPPEEEPAKPPHSLVDPQDPNHSELSRGFEFWEENSDYRLERKYPRLSAHWNAAYDDIESAAYGPGLLVSQAPVDDSEAGRRQPRWLPRLLERWERLLPGAASDRDQYRDRLRQSFLGNFSQTRASVRAFELSTIDQEFLHISNDVQSWELLQQSLRPSVAPDNDLRALYYLRVAADLQRILASNEAEMNVRVRYLGGALRAPMIATASEEAAYVLGNRGTDAGRLEVRLNDWWVSAHPHDAMTIPLPFWLEAVLARADRQQDIPEIISDYRQRSRRLRKRRNELEDAIIAGDERSTTKLRAALSGDAAAVTKDLSAGLKVTLDVVDASLRPLNPLPLGPGKILMSIAETPIQRALMRIFRPHLAMLYDLGRHASRLGNSLPKAWKLFDLPPGVAVYPTKFLQELDHVQEYG